MSFGWLGSFCGVVLVAILMVEFGGFLDDCWIWYELMICGCLSRVGGYLPALP